MQIVYDDDSLVAAMEELAAEGSLGREGGLSAERPVLVDRFLEDAVEVDVDAIRDATGESVIGGVMEHIEEAGVHSGDSACAIPPQTLSAAMVGRIETQTRALADALDVRGLLNVQYAVKDDELYVIEANPRASRTVPFVSKATGVPLAKVASRVMVGATLDELRAEKASCAAGADGGHIAVKEAVLPFNRFPDVDTVLGPEMRSTGEVMGIDRTFGMAFAKSQTAAGNRIPREGTVFFSLADRDKPAGLVAARRFAELGYSLVATAGTADGARGRRPEGRRGGRRRSATAASSADAVDLLALGQGRPGRQHAPGPGTPGRRRPHPPHRHRPGHPVRHHRGRGARGVGRDRGVGVDRGDRPLAAGVPPRRPAAAGGCSGRPRRHARVASTLAGADPHRSGTFGHGDEVAKLGDPARLGAVTAKSISAEPWAGKPAPRLHMTASGMLNAVGLQGPGIDGVVGARSPARCARPARA